LAQQEVDQALNKTLDTSETSDNDAAVKVAPF